MTFASRIDRAREIVAHPEFRRGAIDIAGLGFGIGAWGLVTGVAMVKSGMSVGMAIFMSLAVYAGSAQIAVMPLMASGSPIWVMFLTATCVNLRFVIFSALWRQYFQWMPRRTRMVLGYFSGDVTYVTFMKKFPAGRPEPDQLEYFCGCAFSNWMSWQIPSIVGIFLANFVPIEWGLAFAGVLTLLAITCSMLVDKPTWIAAGVAASAAVAAYALPLRMNIIVAIAAAVAVGLLVEWTQSQTKKIEQAR